jgi:voltage-gated potassium channel
MVGVALMMQHLIGGFRKSWSDPGFRALLILLFSLLGLGTIFYDRTEGWGLINSLYFCVVAISTVGFGDYTPQTTQGKLFTILFLFCGVGLFVSIVGTLAVNLASVKLEVRERRAEARSRGKSKENT